MGDDYRHELNAAGYKIDGHYFGPSIRSSKTAERCFQEAQDECARHLERQLARVRASGFERFVAARRKRFNG